MANPKPIVVIFTANSNTGTAAIEYLKKKFDDRVHVRAIIRKKGNADYLDELYGGAADIVVGDITKPQILGPVFEGASCAYFATPSTTNRVELTKLFIDACINHGVKHAVILSYLAAEKRETTYQKQFWEIEEYARSKAGTPVKLKSKDKGKELFNPIILRSAPFYQNFYGSLAGIQSGTLYYPLGQHGKLPHVDFLDVGKAIAHVCVDPVKHAGKIYTLIGEYQPGNMIASTIGMKAGVGCKYHDVDDATAIMAFQVLGLQPWIAEGNVETLRWHRNGNGLDYPTGDIKALTGDDATKFGDFVRDYIKPMLA